LKRSVLSRPLKPGNHRTGRDRRPWGQELVPCQNRVRERGRRSQGK